MQGQRLTLSIKPYSPWGILRQWGWGRSLSSALNPKSAHRVAVGCLLFGACNVCSSWGQEQTEGRPGWTSGATNKQGGERKGIGEGNGTVGGMTVQLWGLRASLIPKLSFKSPSTPANRNPPFSSLFGFWDRVTLSPGWSQTLADPPAKPPRSLLLSLGRWSHRDRESLLLPLSPQPSFFLLFFWRFLTSRAGCLGLWQESLE